MISLNHLITQKKLITNAQIPFNLRLKLFDTNDIKVLLLYNNIENNEKTLHLPSAC
jgi:hypothetical protein